MRARPRAVLEGHEGVVVHDRALTPGVELPVHARDRAEQEERLVDQVRAEVEQQAAGLRRVGPLAPGSGAQLGAPALEA